VLYFREKVKGDFLPLQFTNDKLEHDNTIFAFQETAIKHLQNTAPDIKEVMDVSDGEASQYKNCNIFMDQVISQPLLAPNVKYYDS
jgi:hypothetical protein